MTTSFYILCLLVLAQLIFSALIYDIVVKRYRQIADQQWHKFMHRETIFHKIMSLQNCKCDCINHGEITTAKMIDDHLKILFKELNDTENDANQQA